MTELLDVALTDETIKQLADFVDGRLYALIPADILAALCCEVQYRRLVLQKSRDVSNNGKEQGDG